MARSVSFSTTLAEVTPYWEPALWVLIVVVTAGIVGSALWAPSRSGHRRNRRKLFRRSEAKVRREERTAVAAMVPAVGTASTTSDFHPETDVDETDIVADEPQQVPAAAVVETAADDRAPASELDDQAADSDATPVSEPVVDAEPALAAAQAAAVEPAAVGAVTEREEDRAPAPVSANGTSTPKRALHAVARPSGAAGPVTFTDVESGFARLGSDVATLASGIGFFDERSSVPAEMPTWPVEHQQSLAERAAEALADPLDQLLEHSLTVASDVRALDRLLGGRFHDEETAQAIVGTRIDLATLRRHHGGVQQRFTGLAGNFAVLAGTAEQLAKVASIIDATDAVMASWQPTMAEAARTASARS